MIEEVGEKSKELLQLVSDQRGMGKNFIGLEQTNIYKARKE